MCGLVLQRKVCDAGYDEGCVQVAIALVKRGDEARARTMVAKACQAGTISGCEAQGVFALDGIAHRPTRRAGSRCSAAPAPAVKR